MSVLGKKIVNQWFSPLGGLNFLLELNCNKEDIKYLVKDRLPQFYSEVLQDWYKLQCISNKDQSSKKTILWGNENLRYNGNVLFFNKWIKAKQLYVKDIVIDDRFISVKELSEKIKCSHNLFNLHKLIMALPEQWKQKVKEKDLSWCVESNNTMFVLNNKKVVHISSMKSKDVYTILNRNQENPICIKYWEKEFTQKYTWFNIFYFKIKQRIENRMGHFQFNVLYNLIPTKKN